ncbi:MAG: hypothetical protein ACI8UO_006533 [Verrucomicrobiales bacterium]
MLISRGRAIAVLCAVLAAILIIAIAIGTVRFRKSCRHRHDSLEVRQPKG